jgi:hypothetical protein
MDAIEDDFTDFHDYDDYDWCHVPDCTAPIVHGVPLCHHWVETRTSLAV